MQNVTYRQEPDLSPEEVIDVLVRSTLAERRPVDDHDTIRAMLNKADVIVTARLGDRPAFILLSLQVLRRSVSSPRQAASSSYEPTRSAPPRSSPFATRGR